MRQLTSSEFEAFRQARLDYENDNLFNKPDTRAGFSAGFTAALNFTDAQLAALTTERDTLSGALRGLRELERLAIDVADYIRDTSWSMGPIRKLVEYIDNKDKDNERPN